MCLFVLEVLIYRKFVKIGELLYITQPTSPLLTFYIGNWYCNCHKEWTNIANYYQLKSTIYLYFLKFFLTSSYVAWSYPGYSITLIHHVLVGSSRLWQLLRIPLFLVTLAVFRSTGQVFYKTSVGWNMPGVFSHY